MGKAISEGHDLALIADRWVVDYWAWHVARIIQHPIIDLRSKQGRMAAIQLYGKTSVSTSESLAFRSHQNIVL